MMSILWESIPTLVLVIGTILVIDLYPEEVQDLMTGSCLWGTIMCASIFLRRDWRRRKDD